MRTRFVGASIEGGQPSQAVNAGQGGAMTMQPHAPLQEMDCSPGKSAIRATTITS